MLSTESGLRDRVFFTNNMFLESVIIESSLVLAISGRKMFFLNSLFSASAVTCHHFTVLNSWT